MFKLDKNKNGSGVFINPTQSNGGQTLELVVGVDAGSTQTRVCVADAGDAKVLLGENISPDIYQSFKDQVFIIPSIYAVVNDERDIAPKSANLEDNYDSHIIRLNSGAEKPLVGSDRIVRGQKIADSAGLVSRYFDSSTNKMDNPIFYINVLDGIGYAILQKYSGNIPSQVKIHLVISVRPKELNQICQKKMNDNFIGEYVFQWQGVKIDMHISDTLYTTEPEAQITGTSIIMDLAAATCDSEAARDLSDKFNNSDSYIHIEGGGSSIGVEVVKNGNIVEACSSTFQLGGNYLIKVIIDRLRVIKGRTVSEESVRSALQTCLLKNGREREDIATVISECKNQVGLDIFERLRHDVIDITPDLSLLDMDFITLGGRLFKEDDSGTSIGQYFAEYLKQISPKTEVIILQDNYIPHGNLVIGLNEYTLEGDDSNSGTYIPAGVPVTAGAAEE